MSNPKFILLNGFAGAGKSTIARRYIQNHPLALLIEGDELIVNLGHWLEFEPKARAMVYEMTKVLASLHLGAGHDVILPYLVVDAAHVAAFKQIANLHNAAFYNIYLANEKDAAITNLLDRGRWGEPGTDPITDKDLPVITDLYARMEYALTEQYDVVVIDQNGKNIVETYTALITELERSHIGIQREVR